MSIIAILEAAEGGQFFANAAKAADVSTAEARTAIEKLAPAIAGRLKEKAAADPQAFEQLLDLIEEGDASELQQEGALTDNDAQSDGAAILNDIYGPAREVEAALGGFGGNLEKPRFHTLAAIGATAVLASLSAANAPKLAGDGAQGASSGGGGGLLSILLGALVKGLVQGAARQFAPRRRRRRYSSYYGRRRTTRRRKRSIGLDDVFREILTGQK